MSKITLLTEEGHPELYDEFIRARHHTRLKVPYFGTELSTLIPLVAPGLKTLGVDESWRLYVDPEFFLGCEFEHRLGLLAHEMYHPLRLHHVRARRAGVTAQTKELWNICADMEINPRVLSDGFQLPPGGYFPKDFGLEEGLLVEEYFKLALNDPELQQHLQQASSGLPGAGDGGSGVNGIAEPYELPLDTAGIPDVGAAEGAFKSSSALKREAGVKGVGLDPLLDELVAELSGEAKIPWQQTLRGLVRATMIQLGRTGSVRTFQRPSRRSYMSSIIQPRNVANSYRLGVVIDTSGSMTEDALLDACAEVRSLCLETGSRTSVVCCDAATSAPQVFEGSAFQLKLFGGGGTDMCVGINSLDKSSGQDAPDAIIVVTDGLTPWPRESELPKAPLLVVIVGDGPLPPPYIKSVRAE